MDSAAIIKNQTEPQNLSEHPNPFERCGIAALSDFRTSVWRELFSILAKSQAEFLSKQHLFRSPDYKWPQDALRTWSRVWEYPYVYLHLRDWRREYAGSELPRVADIGSGVTFFPFSVARLGFDVVCSDPDPVCSKDLNRARKLVEQSPGNVEFRLIQGSSLPFEDSECDLVYCISVLEHIEEFDKTVREIARILKDNGLVFLTIDLDLQGNCQIGVDRYHSLMASVQRSFDFALPDRTVHPADILDSLHGPFPMYHISKWKRARHMLKQEMVKPLLGRKPYPLTPMHLAVQAFVLQKRQHSGS
jgi:SAM-dependent methyltransferase